HALVGSTVDAGRVRDILAVRGWLASGSGRPPRGFRLVGRATAGVLAAYASLLGEQGDAVTAIEPPPSHRKGPIFLDVLRLIDVPEALGLLAPTRLDLVGIPRGQFAKTDGIYRRAGAGASLTIR